jgi:hypothetical protein
MTLKVEVVVDGRVHTEEALGGSSQFEALHLAIAPTSLLVAGGAPDTSLAPWMRAIDN